MKIIGFIFFLSFSSFTHAELRVCSKGDYEYLDPHQAQSVVEKQLAGGLLYETIVKYNPRTKKLVPFLIERWSSYEEDRIYNLYFEKDISFISPDKIKKKYKLRAEDFLFSLNLYLEKVKEGKIKNDYAANNIEKFEISEPKVLTIKLRKSDPQFMKNLAEEMGVVLSENYYRDLERRNKLSEFYRYPVGTGAYRYKKIDPKELRLYRQNGYHFGTPDVDEVVFNQVKEKDRREKYLKSDLCDIAVDISNNALPKGFVLHENKEDIVFFFEQTRKSPLQRITKLHPLYEFLDFREVSQAVSPRGMRANSFVPSESKLYDKAGFSYKLKLQEMDKVFKKYGVNRIKLYFDKNVQAEIHSLSSFLGLMKNAFARNGVNIALAKEDDADLILRKLNLNGFYEKSLQEYFPLWQGEKNKKWFNALFSQLGKNAHNYPIVYNNFYIGTSPKVSKFYSFRSNNFDLTTVKLKRSEKD